jgi:nicotinamidase-related amidase
MNEHDQVREIIRLKDEKIPLRIDPARAALLVTDVQSYFVHPDHVFGQVLESLQPGVTADYFARVRHTVLPNLQRLIAGCRAAGMPVVYTAAGSRTRDGSDLPGWMKGFDQLGMALRGARVWPTVGDRAWRVDDAVAPQPEDIVLDKPSSGPSASTRLDQMLRNMGVDTIVVAGLTTDVCVAQAARETADRGFTVVVACDACTALSVVMHDAALLAFSLTFGRVRSTDALLDTLTPAAAPVAC